MIAIQGERKTRTRYVNISYPLLLLVLSVLCTQVVGSCAGEARVKALFCGQRFDGFSIFFAKKILWKKCEKA